MKDRLQAHRVISLRGLFVQKYDPRSQKTFTLAVDEFDVLCCDKVCLVGRSGSGKTTLLEQLGLLSFPTSIKRFDVSPYGDQRLMSLIEPLSKRQTSLLSKVRAHTMGFVLQNGGLLPYLTVAENAYLGSQLAGKKITDKAHAHIQDVAERIGIENLLNRYPAELSGGEKQRAAVLRGIASRPHVILADEPTASLDPETSEEVMATLVSVAKEFGAAIIMVSHNAALARQFGFEIRAISTTDSETSKASSLAIPEGAAI